MAGAALFLLSASLLAFEIALLRVFSITSYHHFAYMAVGVALLGFGASGTALVLLRRTTRGREWRLFPWILALTPPALLVAPVLAGLPEFDPTQLVWDPRQWWRLTGVYAALTLPFLTGAAAVALALQGGGSRVGRLYAWNLAGSGAGSLAVLPLLFRFRPEEALAWTVVPAGVAAVLALVAGRGLRAGRAAAAVVVAGVTVVGVARGGPPLDVIHFKGLPQVEAYPGARRAGEAWDPTGWVVAVAAPAFRHAPGLSLGYQGAVPGQVALFVDGEVAGAAVTRSADDLGSGGSYLEWLPGSVVYALQRTTPDGASGHGGLRPSVLVLGAGGGTDLAAALHYGARRVTAVELVEPLVRLAREVVSASSSPWDDPRVRVVTGDARSFAARSRDRFSLVVLPISGVFNATAAGIHSAGEDFLGTAEAYRAFLRLLEPGGILVVTRWLRTPPRDNVRVILTAAEALRSMGVSDVGRSLAFVRSWATGTLLVKPAGFAGAEIADLRRFADARAFDVDWPGTAGGPGPFNEIAAPVYQDAARAAARGADSAVAFARAYPFDVRPATDDRPWFGRFLRLGTLPALLAAERADWLPLAEWGTLGVVATLAQSGLLAVLLMAVPVLVLHPSRGRATMPVLRPAFYFAGIGFGFILVEMAGIQRLSLVLGHPVYATAATLGALLLCSGVGSAWSDRRPDAWASRASLVVAGLAALGALLAPAAARLSSLPLAVRGPAALVVVGAAGVLMGVPFPLGLRRLARSEGGVAWAWAANGVASVVGASAAVLLAMEVGSRGVLLAGAACYLVAGGAARGRGRQTSSMGADLVPAGVTFIDHAADVGLDVVAPTLGELFARAAAGMACLIHGADLGGDTPDPTAAATSGRGARGPSRREPLVERRLTLSADDPATLLRAWLRELLHWHEAEGLTLRDTSFDVLDETHVEATVALAPDTVEPIREIKGVTLHGLVVERRDGGWVGRVIFDV